MYVYVSIKYMYYQISNLYLLYTYTLHTNTYIHYIYYNRYVILYIQYIYSHDILLISQNWLQNSKNIYLEKDISYI